MTDEVDSTELLKHAYDGDMTADELQAACDDKNLDFEGPYGIVDPRCVGFSYVSYVFIKSRENLEQGFDASRDIFEYKHRALMLGSVLGEYDFVHRRVDKNTHRHVGFTVDAINDEDGDMEFVRNAETYPIFTIGRWHGQDIDDDDMTGPTCDDLSTYEAELLYTLIRKPNQNAHSLADAAHNRIAEKKSPSLYDTDNSDQFKSNYQTPEEVAEHVEELEKKYKLGTAMTLNVSDTEKIHALVGLSVKPGIETDEKTHPHEKVMTNITDKFEGWELPYVVSGVGKAWGDILVEVHIDEIDEMEYMAKRLRSVDGVATTKTFAITNAPFNRPYVPQSPDYLPTE